jgi:hypothetical protein
VTSTFHWRKEAPLHFWAKADNARACTYRLYHHAHESIDYKKVCGYNGDPSIGFHEGYLREAAVSLELIIKAVISTLNEKSKRNGKVTYGIPKNHALPELWRIAKLPKLNKHNQLRLRNFQAILEWLGRYPTPKDEKQWIKDIKECTPVPTRKNGLNIIQPLSLGWTEFDRLYCIAISRFNELQKLD